MLPKHCESIGYGVFDDCPNLSSESREAIERAVKAASSKKSGGCYIATAVYGSYDCPEVWTLRRYRDFRLEKSSAGRAFIKTYYAVAPWCVKHFGKSAWFNAVFRRILDKKVRKLNAEGFSFEPYDDN